MPSDVVAEPLVERIAITGANAGKSFTGCSAFPRCRYTRQNGERA